MQVKRIGDWMDFASCVPENVPEYFYHYKYNDPKTSVRQNRNQHVQINEPQKTKLECLNFQLNTQKFQLPENSQSKIQFNKDLRLYFQKLRMQKMIETQKQTEKNIKIKTNYNFYKGTLSVVQSNIDTRQNLKKMAVKIVQGGAKQQQILKYLRQDEKTRNQLTNKIFMKFREQIFLVYENKDVIINLCKYFEFLSKNEFIVVLKILGCKNYDNFFEQYFFNQLRIFWVFDKNQNNILELNDVLQACQKFVDFIAEYKVKGIFYFKKVFFDYCDNKKEGYLNEIKIFAFLCDNLKYDHEKQLLQNYIQEFMSLIKCKNIERIQQQELVDSCKIHQNLLKIIESNISKTKTKKKNIEKQEVNFSQFDLTTGLSLPYYNKVLDYVKTGEDLYENLRLLKQSFKDRVIKDKNYESDDDL